MPNLAKETRENLNAVLVKNASDAASIARQIVPVDTGFLQESIAVSVSSGGVIRLEANAPYAGYVEYGTVHMSPQPFIRPAIDAVAPDLERDLKKILMENMPVIVSSGY
jgi:HK97 gp10 family phage protein